MTTTEIIKTLSKRLAISQRDARRFFKQMFEEISQSLEKGETMVIRGFGSFGTRVRKSRKSYHPTARRFMQLPPKRVVRFRPSSKLKESVAARREP